MWESEEATNTSFVLCCSLDSIKVIFNPVLKLSVLSKLKSPISLLSNSHVVYKVNCDDCREFYVGMTCRRLSQRKKEHSESNVSALCRHSLTAKHTIPYNMPQILARDNSKSRLYTKEALLIKELKANKTLNGNIRSTDLKLWSITFTHTLISFTH